MFLIGLILLIVGAVIAIAARGRDDAVRWIGLGVAILGAILILVAVVPNDVDVKSGALFIPFWRLRWRRKKARVHIDPEFGRVLAAQVAVGMAPTMTARWGEGAHASLPPLEQFDGGRARASLATIGIMLLNACQDDPVIQETLRTDLEIHEEPGVTTLRRVS